MKNLPENIVKLNANMVYSIDELDGKRLLTSTESAERMNPKGDSLRVGDLTLKKQLDSAKSKIGFSEDKYLKVFPIFFMSVMDNGRDENGIAQVDIRLEKCYVRSSDKRDIPSEIKRLLESKEK